MKRLQLGFLIIPLTFSILAHASTSQNRDIDGDGIPDDLKLGSLEQSDDGQTLSQSISIKLSSAPKEIKAHIQVEDGDINIYLGKHPGDIIIDTTNHAGRDAAELKYYIYRWNKDIKAICLHASVNGVPANQLKGEYLPRDMAVTRFLPCTSLNDKKEIAVAISNQAEISSALNEISSFGREEEIPEYLAFELASLLSQSNVVQINDAGYHQEQANFLRPALILLQAVNKKFPRRLVTKLNLADTYWKIGDKKKACEFYRNYVAGIQEMKKNSSRTTERPYCAAPG